MNTNCFVRIVTTNNTETLETQVCEQLELYKNYNLVDIKYTAFERRTLVIYSAMLIFSEKGDFLNETAQL